MPYNTQVYTITWTSDDWLDPDGNVLPVKIELSRNGGATWATIAASAPNTGSFNWTVTGPGSANCIIRISDPADPSVYDDSAAFAIDFYPIESTVCTPADGGPALWGPGGVGFGPGTFGLSVSSQSSYSHSSHSDSSSSYSDSISVSSGSTSVSSDSSPSSSSLSLEGDCIQAQITAKLKALLETVTTANGYHYDVQAVEQARKVLEINNRWPFILLCENEPETDTDLVIRTIDYIVWFFGEQDDELTADNVKDHDNEIAYHNRNAIADITKAINVNIYLDGFAENVEVEPGTNDLYVDGNTTLFGTWCLVRVTTNIDSTDPYKLR